MVAATLCSYECNQSGKPMRASGASPFLGYLRENLNDLYGVELPKDRDVRSRKVWTFSTLSFINVPQSPPQPGDSEALHSQNPFSILGCFHLRQARVGRFLH